jgi:hypothetical protein
MAPPVAAGGAFVRVRPGDRWYKRSVVNKITWQRAGGVTEPGRYMFTFGWLTVTADDLAVWKMYPDAAFTLVKLPGNKTDALDAVVAEEFHLGAFELSPRGANEP